MECCFKSLTGAEEMLLKTTNYNHTVNNPLEDQQRKEMGQ